jgi:hypothetical protein
MMQAAMHKPFFPTLRYVKAVAVFYALVAILATVAAVLVVAFIAYPYGSMSFAAGIACGIVLWTGVIRLRLTKSIGGVGAAFGHAIHCD